MMGRFSVGVKIVFPLTKIVSYIKQLIQYKKNYLKTKYLLNQIYLQMYVKNA